MEQDEEERVRNVIQLFLEELKNTMEKSHDSLSPTKDLNP
jgi:hypothetical protein